MMGNLGCLRPGDVIASASDIDELLRYRELKEQNRLIELPCANGDVVYWRNVAGEIKRATICGYNLSAECNDGRGYTIRPEIIGKTVFFTREEAETALKGENNL